MNKPFLIAVSILFSATSFAQKIRFSDTTNVWCTRELTEPTPHAYTMVYNSSHYTGSIVVGGRQYHIIDDWAYIREDTIASKVYMRFSTDTFDRLLYDYNAVAGDTVVNYVNAYPYAMMTKNYVTSVSSTTIDGISYRVWNMDNGGFHIIEGLGCAEGFQLPVTPLVSNSIMQLLCFYNEGSKYPLGTPVPTSIATFSYYNMNFDNSASCALNAEQTRQKNVQLTVIPNPTDQSGNIVFSYSMTGSLVVFNSIGQAIIRFAFQNQDKILIGDKVNVPGIYFYSVTDNGSGQTYSGKFTYR